MSFLDRLDELIKKNNLNKHQLAQETGIPYSTIDSFYKKGYENIKLSTLRKLAEYFNCSLDYLVEYAQGELSFDDASEYIFERINRQDELTEYLDELQKRPEMKMLFKVAKKASKEDVEKAVKIIEMFREKSSDGDDI